MFGYPTGREGAELLGYEPSILSGAHPGLLRSFCGVGNPFSLGEIPKGAVLLDFGCGAGFDLFVASRLVGPAGRAVGVDLTWEMVACARTNLAAAGAANGEVVHLDSGTLPFPRESFDVVISNGVINLCPDKLATLRELARVLQPDGRLQLADVIREDGAPAAPPDDPDAWAQ